MKNGQTAIVLGGIFPHGEVIKKLKRRGYFTVLIDYFENPPAAMFADVHLQESAMDYEAVLDAAQKYKAGLVLSPCLDQQMVIAVKVAETLGLPRPFSSETALQVTNKKYMKKIMLENGIPTSQYYTVTIDTDLDSIRLDYPVIVKPTDSCGAAGVRKIGTPGELLDAVTNACKWSRTREAVIEEYKEGVEVSAYTFVRHGKASLITTQNRISVIGNGIVKCCAAFNPAKISDTVRSRIEELATDIATAFKLDNVPLFYQAIVNKDTVSIIEFSPRLGGGVCYRLMEKNAAYDMLEASIDSWLGLENLREPAKEKEKYLIYQVQGREGVLDYVCGYEKLMEQGVIDDIFFHKTRNMRITTEKASSSRVAALLIKGETEEECFLKLAKAAAFVQVIDIYGNDITDKTNTRIIEKLFRKGEFENEAS